MYKVLIVDDEPIAIDSVEYIIKNRLKELEVAGRARSGREAIEKAYNLRPDIVLIDIKMPGINGLDAIRQIRGTNPDVYFIIMSAYDYFDYAAEAMTMGVVEYLLKPVKEVKLVEALKKAMDVIQRKRRQISRELELEEKMEIIVPTLENGFIQTLCMAEDNTEELINFSRLFELEDKGGYVMAIEFGGGDGEGIQNKISASVQTQNHYIGYKNILKSICRCIVGPIMLNRLIVFIPNVSGEDGYSIKDSAIRLAKDFSDRIRNSIGNVKIGIGRHYKDILNSKKSYHEALQALLTASGSPDPILHIDDMVRVFQEIPDSESKFEHEIYTKAAEGDINSALLALDNVFSQIEDSSENLDCIRDKCIIMAADFTKRVGSVSHAFHSVLVRIMSAGSNTDLKIILRNYVKQMMDELSVRRQKRINSIIEKADNYLAEHYSEDITLEETARAVNLSPYYFSRFYKEESGVNFIDRLIAIRIEKAKHYFEATDISLKEVSGMVGYSDPNYFSKLFKKTTGYTATEYREFYRK